MSHMPLAAPTPLRIKDATPLRWANVRTLLVLQGLPQDRARTEAARIGAVEAWEMVNGWRRRERAVGSAATARTLEAALRPLQDVVINLLRNPGDLLEAGTSVRKARRSFAQFCAQTTAAVDSAAGGVVDGVFGSLDALLSPCTVRKAA